MPDSPPPPPDPAPSGRVTLRHVADALGISHVAVSLALRNSPEISAARRQQVQAMAAHMGYRPNAMGAGLAEYRRNAAKPPVTAAIGWLHHWPEPTQFRVYREFELYWEGASEAAARHGYRLDEFACERTMSLARVEQVLRARGVRGLVLAPLCRGQQVEWGDFNWSQFSVVRFGYSIRNLRVHTVASNQFFNTRLALDQLNELGYRRIGYVSHREVSTFFIAGLLYAQAHWPAAERLAPLILQDDDQALRKVAFLTWVRGARPDAILTEIGQVRGWLEEAGYSIPEDIGLAALSVHDGGSDSGIDQRPWHIGKAAVEVVISRINNNDLGLPEVCRDTLIEGTWCEGTSLRPQI